jgi:hypothetical protein
MKNIDVYEELIVRACKKRKNLKTLKKILSMRNFGNRHQLFSDHYLSEYLLYFIQRNGILKDWANFVLSMRDEKDFDQVVINKCIKIIGNSKEFSKNFH